MKLRFISRKNLKRAAAAAVIAMIAIPLLCWLTFLVLDAVFPFPLHEVYDKDSTQSLLVYDREGGVIGAKVSSEDTWHFILKAEEIPDRLRNATIAIEDKRFYSHHGVDPIAVCRALCKNVFFGRRISGASTITMQVIRITHPRPRTYRSKIVEMFRALQIERILSKDEILTLYLNNAPYGRNIVGVKAAAWRYYKKEVRNLSLAETAVLAGLPKAPSSLDPVRYPVRCRRRRNQVLSAMRKNGMIDEYSSLSESAVPVYAGSLSQVPKPNHLTDLVEMKYGRNGTVRSTVDPKLQKYLQEYISEKSRELEAKGIDSAGMVIIDVRTSSLQAAVSWPPYSTQPDGQFNRVFSMRQAGSTLKPFLYAACADSGILTPSTMLKDAPCSWNGYAPENYDRRYRTLVSAREALRNSINIPAVHILETYGGDRFYGILGDFGIDLTYPYSRYGLSLGLGSCEVKPVTLANAYAALARLGEYRPLRLSIHDPAEPGIPAVSSAAAYMVLDCLNDRTFSQSVTRYGEGIRAAYKTGTSWDYRDAWCMYVTKHHVAGVWLGNSGGSSSAALVGAVSAVPLAREFLILHMNPESFETWEMPSSLCICEFCKQTGELKGAHCPDSRRDFLVQGKSSLIPCSHRQTGVAVSQPETGRDSLSLLSPADGSVYLFTETLPESLQKISFRAEYGKEKKLYWFLNSNLIASGTDQIIWSPKPGSYTLTCSTEDGKSKTTRFKVLNNFPGQLR